MDFSGTQQFLPFWWLNARMPNSMWSLSFFMSHAKNTRKHSNSLLSDHNLCHQNHRKPIGFLVVIQLSTNGGDINSRRRIQIKVWEREVGYICKWATHIIALNVIITVRVATMDIAMVNILLFCSHKMPSTNSKVCKYGWCLWDSPCSSKHVKINTYIFHMLHVLR